MRLCEFESCHDNRRPIPPEKEVNHGMSSLEVVAFKLSNKLLNQTGCY